MTIGQAVSEEYGNENCDTRILYIRITGKLILSLLLGVTSLTIVLITVLTDPVLIIAKYNCRVDYGTYTYDALNVESDGVLLSAYLFNVTNAERFQTGVDHKLKVEEVGPFTYQEFRKHELLEIDKKAEVMRYSPKIRTQFLPEESIGDPKDMDIVMPNIAFLSMASKVGSYSLIPRMAFNMLTSRLKSKAFVHMKAEDYLWGYEEPLIKLGNTVLPGLVNFDILGVLDRLYDKKSRYLFEVSAKDEDKFLIKSVNGTAGLEVWGYNDEDKRTLCNSFTDTYEGICYPPDMAPNRNIRIFRNVLCRILEFDFHSIIPNTEYGTKGFLYKISDRTYTLNNATSCLCNKGICREGVSDISPCFLGLPIVLSNAHFTGADPNLYEERVQGMEPNEERHAGLIIIEPKIGIALETIFSVQVNIMMGDANFNEETSRFSNMVVPIAYFKIDQPKLNDVQLYNIKLVYVIGPAILLTLQIALFILGVVLLSYSVLLLYCSWLNFRRKGILRDCVKKSSVQVPLVN